MSREAAKKIVDLMITHGTEQNAILTRYNPFVRTMNSKNINE
jgi:hypothetical protein